MSTPWIMISYWEDIPDDPEGYQVEVQYQDFMGIAIAYRFVNKEE